MVMAYVYARVGEDEKAVDMLAELLAIPSHVSVNLLKIDPWFDPLRDNPRFQALLETEGMVF
jgi:hypothetical protein